MLKRTVPLFLAIIMTGCANNAVIESQSQKTFDYSSLYLRGSFSWWEADDSYRVVPVSDNTYRVVVELVADGQPYDFKFADKSWTMGLSCGYKNKEQDETIQLDRPVTLNCYTPVDNFVFKPTESGKYLFTLNFKNIKRPSLVVTKI